MMFWHGWRREVESQSAASGLTGAPELVEPPPEPPKNWRQRWAEVRRAAAGTTAALPRVITLVWQASPGLTIALFAVTALAGVMPAATAYTSKLLINAVVNAIKIHAQNAPDRARLDVGFYHSPVLTTLGVIVFVAAIQLAIAALSALLSTVRNIAQQLLQELVQMRIQLMVMEHAARLDLPFFEDPASYDLLRRAQSDSANRPVAMISTAFGLVQTAITFVSMVALLLAVSPLLAALGLLGGFSGMYEHNLYLSNLFDLLGTKTGVAAPAAPRALPQPVRGEVVFEHVSFGYPGQEGTALNDLSFRIAPGETVAVVGRN